MFDVGGGRDGGGGLEHALAPGTVMARCQP